MTHGVKENAHQPPNRYTENAVARACMSVQVFTVIIVMTRHIQSECRTTAMSISGVSLLIISVLNAHLL